MKETAAAVFASLAKKPEWFLPSQRSFEIFGLDFLPTDDGTVKFLEASPSPPLWLAPHLLEDAFRLVADAWMPIVDTELAHQTTSLVTWTDMKNFDHRQRGTSSLLGDHQAGFHFVFCSDECISSSDDEPDDHRAATAP